MSAAAVVRGCGGNSTEEGDEKIKEGNKRQLLVWRSGSVKGSEGVSRGWIAAVYGHLSWLVSAYFCERPQPLIRILSGIFSYKYIQQLESQILQTFHTTTTSHEYHPDEKIPYGRKLN